MHPLGLLPSITFYTTLATHILTDTFKTLGTDAAEQRIRQHLLDAAHPAALAGRTTCSNEARRFGLAPLGRAEQYFWAAGFTKSPSPGQLKSQSHQNLQLCCCWVR
jgi:hypothetical protein